MGNARGADSQLLGYFESAWGTFETSVNFMQLPYIRHGFGAGESFDEDTVLNSRDPQQPIQSNLPTDGDIEVPIDLRNIGVWLKGLLGAPTTTGGSAPYTHTFNSGASALPSLSLELGHPATPAYLKHAGAMVNTMRIPFAPSGAMNATLDLLAKDEVKAGSSGGGTPTVATYTRFSGFHGALTREGSALGKVKSANLNISNNLEGEFYVDGSRYIDDITLGQMSIDGDITIRFASTQLYDDAVAGTDLEIGMVYAIDSDNKLTFTLYAGRLAKPKISVPGPGGIDVTFPLRGGRQADGSLAMDVVLINDVASY